MVSEGCPPSWPTNSRGMLGTSFSWVLNTSSCWRGKNSRWLSRVVRGTWFRVATRPRVIDGAVCTDILLDSSQHTSMVWLHSVAGTAMVWDLLLQSAFFSQQMCSEAGNGWTVLHFFCGIPVLGKVFSLQKLILSENRKQKQEKQMSVEVGITPVETVILLYILHNKWNNRIHQHICIWQK